MSKRKCISGLLILALAAFLCGCSVKDTENTSNLSVVEVQETSESEVEAVEEKPEDPAEKYSYIGNQVLTQQEPIQFEEGLVSSLDDDLDGDGEEERILLTASCDGTVVSLNLQVYELVDGSYVSATPLSNQKVIYIMDSMDGRNDFFTYSVYFDDHTFYVQESESEMTSYVYDGTELVSQKTLEYWGDVWKSDHTKLVGSVYYAGFEMGDHQFIYGTHDSYCISLINGADMSSALASDFIVPYPSNWVEYIEFATKAISKPYAGEGLLCNAKGVISGYSEEDDEWSLFSVSSLNTYDPSWFCGDGGTNMIWYNDHSMIGCAFGGDWYAGVCELTNNHDINVVLKTYVLTIQAQDFVPVLTKYTGNEEGQYAIPFYYDGMKALFGDTSTSSSTDLDNDTWGHAYYNWITDNASIYGSWDGCEFGLIYVDDNDIPELVINTNAEVSSSLLLTYADGIVDEMITERLYFEYIERGNLLANMDGNMDHYHDYIYSIQNGKWVKIAEGNYYGYTGEYDDANNRYVCQTYEWNGETVDMDTYLARLNETYDFSKSVISETLYTQSQMMELLSEN